MRKALMGALIAPAMVLGATGCGSDDDAGRSATEPTAASTPTSPATQAPGKVRMQPGLPADFPKDDVPLIDAEVIGGMRGETGGLGWSVVLKPTGRLPAIAKQAAALLEEAGYTAGPGTAQSRLQVLQYSNKNYLVGVTVVLTNDGTTMTYTVSRKQ